MTPGLPSVVPMAPCPAPPGVGSKLPEPVLGAPAAAGLGAGSSLSELPHAMAMATPAKLSPIQSLRKKVPCFIFIHPLFEVVPQRPPAHHEALHSRRVRHKCIARLRRCAD